MREKLKEKRMREKKKKGKIKGGEVGSPSMVTLSVMV